MKRHIKRPLNFLIMLAIGVIIAFLLVLSRSPLKHSDTTLKPRPVEVLVLKTLPFKARVTGYGTVEPAIVLQSKAEVSGKVSYTHPRLKQGGNIRAGTVVLRIDAKDYQTSLKQTQADLLADKSSLAQLVVEETSTRRSLQLAKRNLSVGLKELKRIKRIWKQRLIARSTLDAEQQKVIQLKQQVEELSGKLTSYISRKNSVKAKISRSSQQVIGRQTTLGRTEVTLPFDARIGQVFAKDNEFVSVGSKLFEALSIDGVEINVQLPIAHMRNLIMNINTKEFKPLGAGNFRNILKKLKLCARVRLVSDIPDAVWDGKVVRLSESIDPVRRTLGVIVIVNRPYEQAIYGRRPPLMKGMYTAVDLYTPARDSLVVPREAIHQGRVYVANKDNKLEIRTVKTLFVQNNVAVITKGLQPGDKLIVNDLIPVIEGMPVKVRINKKFNVEFLKRVAGAN